MTPKTSSLRASSNWMPKTNWLIDSRSTLLLLLISKITSLLLSRLRPTRIQTGRHFLFTWLTICKTQSTTWFFLGMTGTCKPTEWVTLQSGTQQATQLTWWDLRSATFTRLWAKSECSRRNSNRIRAQELLAMIGTFLTLSREKLEFPLSSLRITKHSSLREMSHPLLSPHSTEE